MSSEVIAAIIGALVGSGVSLLWDGFLRRRLEARNLAEVLTAETSLNLQLLHSRTATRKVNPRSVPSFFRLYGDVYRALIPRLGELPARVQVGLGVLVILLAAVLKTLYESELT